MISNNGHRFPLNPVLHDLAADCERDGVVRTCPRACVQTDAWCDRRALGRPRTAVARRMREFYTYLENAALAVALSNERQRIEAASAELREKAYRDTLTGLPTCSLSKSSSLRTPTGSRSVLSCWISTG